MRHILIIGGTGMLRGTTEHFIQKGNIVTMMARNESRLKSIKEKYPEERENIMILEQDYRNAGEALEKVKKTADMYMPIHQAILWIHTSGQRFSNKVKEFLFSHHPKTKVWQLWGSATINPKELSQTWWRKHYPKRYREIFLGYMKNGSSTRWLTNREISEGTIRAVETDKPEYSIGLLQPWR